MELRLNVVTPEKSVVRDTVVESVIIPGELGQLNVLPGHINLVTALAHGSFAYKTGGIWNWAYLDGGFAEVRDNQLRVLAETMDLAHEIDVAKIELRLQSVADQLKKLKAGDTEFNALQAEQRKLSAQIAVAKKQA